MDIGLLDQDAILSPETFYPNLEIMKLSSYYKKNKNFVSLILNPKEVDRYTKIVLRKDTNDENYLSNLFLNKKCEYGGLAFTNNIYKPLEKEIENCIPDISIYNSYFNKILLKLKKGEILKRKFLQSSYIRLSTDGINCDLDYQNGFIGASARSQNIVYVYDNNILEIKDSKEAINDIIKGKQQFMKLIHVQESKDFEKISNWCVKAWNSSDNKIIYNKIVYNKEFKEICSMSKDFTLKPFILICYDKNKTYTDNFLKADFKNSLNRALYIMTTKARVQLMDKEEYENENFKLLYRSLIYWIEKSFKKYSFKEFLFNRSKKQFIFLEDLANNDAVLRELINIVPKKICDKGGKWLL